MRPTKTGFVAQSGRFGDPPRQSDQFLSIDNLLEKDISINYGNLAGAANKSRVMSRQGPPVGSSLALAHSSSEFFNLNSMRNFGHSLAPP